MPVNTDGDAFPDDDPDGEGGLIADDDDDNDGYLDTEEIDCLSNQTDANDVVIWMVTGFATLQMMT